jgi:hypothetical protein
MVEKTNVQPEVDEVVIEKAIPEVEKNAPKEKTIEQLVVEVIKGVHGSGRERMLSLGDKYEAVQHEVNQLIKKGEVR